jgi:hypothetical protein
MKKQKVKLESLKIRSFKTDMITELKAKGGERSAINFTACSFCYCDHH